MGRREGRSPGSRILHRIIGLGAQKILHPGAAMIQNLPGIQHLIEFPEYGGLLEIGRDQERPLLGGGGIKCYP